MKAYDIVLYSWIAIAAATFVVLLFIRAPYGRHIRKGFGPMMPNRLGWLLMEAPSSILMLCYYFLSQSGANPVFLVFLMLWQIHYIHRSFIYPFRIRTSKKYIPVLVVCLAIFFNAVNTYLNGMGIFMRGPVLNVNWFTDVRFCAGLLVFLTGFIINIHSDHILRNIRKDSFDAYKVPERGLFRWISCPNYFGEILEWTGWAVLTWSVAGLSFALWTFANLVPRALHHHKWYKNQFPGYSSRKKAVIPFIL